MKNLTIKEIQSKTVPILRANGATKAELFGSVARGEATEASDVDILVELPDEQSLLDVIHLKNELEDALGTTVDLVEYDAIKPMLRPYIMQHLIPLL